MSAIAALLIVLPWLNPLAGGPSPAVVPWLLTVGCAALLVLGPGLKESRRPDTVAWAWFMAAAVSSVMGLVQYFGISGSLFPWVNVTMMGEAFANLRQRNQFATLTNIGLVALLWWSAQRRSSPSTLTLGGTGALTAAALLATANAASASRTGLLQLALLGVVIWFRGGMRQPEIRRLMLVAMLAYMVAAVALPVLLGGDPAVQGVLGRLRRGDLTCGSRLTLWRNVLHLIGQSPWWGWGWGELDYAHFITLYEGPRFCEILGNAHNLPLHVAVELGLPAALLMCGAAAWMTWRAKPWRETDPARQMAWGVLALIALHSLVEYPLWYGPFQMALGISLGLLGRRPATDLHRPGMDGTRWVQGLAVLLLAATAYAAWDYHRISQIYLPPGQRSAAYRDDTLEKIQGSWLFQDQVRFAELTLTPLTRDNAAQLYAMAHDLLHFSPEATVVEKLIESAVLLGRDEEARFYMRRYQAAYPEAYDARRAGRAVPGMAQ